MENVCIKELEIWVEALRDFDIPKIKKGDRFLIEKFDGEFFYISGDYPISELDLISQNFKIVPSNS